MSNAVHIRAVIYSLLFIATSWTLFYGWAFAFEFCLQVYASGLS